MTGGFVVDAEGLGSKASEFATLAEQADRIATTLREELDGAGPAWGTDAVGRSFAALHDRRAAETGDLCAGLCGGLTELGTRLGDAATRYVASDADAGQHVAPRPGDR